MARVVVTVGAAAELRSMIRTHSLPRETPDRVRRSIARLADFPLMGPPLGGRWLGYRFILGPWPWMVLVYEIIEDDVVAVVTIQDARTSSAATGAR